MCVCVWAIGVSAGKIILPISPKKAGIDKPVRDDVHYTYVRVPGISLPAVVAIVPVPDYGWTAFGC
jgi:hypothetical protein